MKHFLTAALVTCVFATSKAYAQAPNVWGETLPRDQSNQILAEGRVLSFEVLGTGRGGITSQHILFVEYNGGLYACRLHLEQTFDNMAGEYVRDVVARCITQLSN